MRPLNPAPGTRALDPERLGSFFIGLAIGIALLLLFLWWTFHTQLATAILFVQGLELDLIGLFTHQYDSLRANLRDAIPERVSPGTLWTLCTITGSVLRWPVLIILLSLAVTVIVRAPRERYRQRFDLNGLQAALARIHPIGAAWVGGTFPLAEPAPVDERRPAGHWTARPMDPALRLQEWKERFMSGPDLITRRRQAVVALKAQLGSPWTGLSSLSPPEKVLFLAFALYIVRRKDDAQAVLEGFSSALSGALSNGAPDLPATLPPRFLKSLDQKISTEPLDPALVLARRHGWTRTVLLSLLQEARLKSGVVNPGLFAPVQLVDRDLWLILAAPSYPRDGRPSHHMTIAPCIEAAAAISHWVRECQAGEALTEPDVAPILAALETA